MAKSRPLKVPYFGKRTVPPIDSLDRVKMYGIRKLYHSYTHFGNSLVVQWLGLSALTAEGLGSIPGRGTKIPQAVRCSQKIQKKKLYSF